MKEINELIELQNRRDLEGSKHKIDLDIMQLTGQKIHTLQRRSPLSGIGRGQTRNSDHSSARR